MRHKTELAATRDKGTGGGQPPNTAGGNTTRGETTHRGTPPANTSASSAPYIHTDSQASHSHLHPDAARRLHCRP